MIGAREATGALLETYELMAQRSRPAVYTPAHGDAAAIIRAHSLDAELMRLTFRVSGDLNGKGPLTWPQRELVNAATSRINQCFY